jgi:hypothetical protein
MYQGKQLDVLWMDDHLIFRQQNSMLFRRNARKCNWKIEIITQPGAEFPLLLEQFKYNYQ